MSKSAATKNAPKPLSINLPEEMSKKVKRLAEKNHLPVTAVLRMALVQGLPKVLSKFEGVGNES